MFDVDDPVNLAVRAANYIQWEHAPSYIGLRFFLGSIPSENLGNWLKEFVSRKISVRQPLSYLKTPLLKSIDEDGTPKYRDFFVASPTTLLIESWLLSSLGASPAFATHPSVYSYRWPHKNSGRAFSYFFDGYSERDQKIEGILTFSEELSASVFDIKSFYPSINQKIAADKFFSRLRLDENLSKYEDVFKWAIDQLLQQTPNQGIPIGSAISHILANVYLEDIDNILKEKYDHNYFRYVDDIIIISKECEIQDVKSTIVDQLNHLGLSLNEEKIDFVTGPQWEHRDPMKAIISSPTSFDAFVKRLTAFLAVQPDRFSQLHDILKGKGYRFPLSSIRSVSNYSKYRWFLKGRLPSFTFKERFKIAFGGPEEILEAAEHLRKEFQQRRLLLSQNAAPLSGMQRRWWIRAWRYTISRLLYLEPIDDIFALTQNENFPEELHDLRLLIESLQSNDFSQLLLLPGRTLKAAAELYSSNDDNNEVLLNLPEVWSKELCEGLATLGVYGVIEKPNMRQWKDVSKEDIAYINFCFSDIGNKRIYVDQPHMDELHSLSLFYSIDEKFSVLKERFSDDEEVRLSGLNIGDYQYI